MEKKLSERSEEPSNNLLWILGSLSALVVFFIIGLIIYQDHPKTVQSFIPKATSLLPFTSNTQSSNSIASNAVATVTPNLSKPDNAIVRVGNEFIYKKDLDTEMQFAPPNTDKKSLLNKLIIDSVILQGAAEDNLITLNAEVFNAPVKNYPKRVQLVNQAINAVKNNSTKISGTVITMWFFNNDIAGTLGYDKGKVFALQKITTLHNDVKSGKLTIDQALDQVKHDDSLAQIELEHVHNAGFSFNAQIGQGPTVDEYFNKLIWNLKKGEISDIVSIKDPNSETGKTIDVAYAFAQVKQKITNNNIPNYTVWLENKKHIYAVTYYQ